MSVCVCVCVCVCGYVPVCVLICMHVQLCLRFFISSYANETGNSSSGIIGLCKFDLESKFGSNTLCLKCVNIPTYCEPALY